MHSIAGKTARVWAATSLLTAGGAFAGDLPDDPLEQRIVPVALDSGFVVNRGTKRAVIYSGAVVEESAPWLRLVLDDATLGAVRPGGTPTILRLTSLLDGAVQTMNAEHVAQWQYTSAYFNGDGVLVEIIADPGAAPSRVVITEAHAGVASGPMAEAICGLQDDRVLSSDPRSARKFPYGCTVFLIDDPAHSFLSAGHCATDLDVVEFNVPLSASNGSAIHPPPADQYAVDPVSLQHASSGVGNDWSYFGCFANSTTGLTAFEAQGACYVRAAVPPPATLQPLEVVGYGITELPVPMTWSRAQKIGEGNYVAFGGSTIFHSVDTTTGNSGSAIYDPATDRVIGIHTHGGCEVGTNKGTAINQAGLVNAIANPQGVCIPSPPCLGDIDGPAGVPDGEVGFFDLLRMLAQWGPCSGCAADVDGPFGVPDGQVSFFDLLRILAGWGPCP
jgi:V8-like Glu-specific endopeptidase